MSRHVVVTGGGKGIGRSCVERFLASGDQVTAFGRDEAALAAVAALGAQVELCDVSQPASIQTAFGALAEPVDVLVNNAGIAESAPLHRTTLELWNRHLAVNATGPFLCIQAVLPAMRERDRGSIITVASVAGRRGSRYTSAYTASKHAVIGLTRAAAAEVAGTGVRVNAVCPAYVRSPMTDRTIANITQRTDHDAQAAERILAEMSPLGRLIEPEEVADAVVWLASEAAATINGQSLVLDGGGVQV
jgi:NAD(P)-dependent dehydrogenase (short-subunit alcohol dehydrogenase family)